MNDRIHRFRAEELAKVGLWPAVAEDDSIVSLDAFTEASWSGGTKSFKLGIGSPFLVQLD